MMTIDSISSQAQAGLFSLTSLEVLNMALPQGDYTFYFAIDEPHDGAACPCCDGVTAWDLVTFS
jgi:hypothetical protein